MKIYIHPTAQSEQHSRDVIAAAQSLTNEDLSGDISKKLTRMALDHRRDYASEVIPAKSTGQGYKGVWLLRSTTYPEKTFDVLTVDQQGHVAYRARRGSNPDVIEIRTPNKRSAEGKRRFPDLNRHLRQLTRDSSKKLAAKIAGQLDWDDDRRDRLTSLLHAIERKRIKGGLRDFMGLLDGRTLETARQMGLESTHDLNWLNADGKEEGRENRRRVVQSLGVLAPIIMDMRNTTLLDNEQTQRARRFFKEAQNRSLTGQPVLDDLRAVLSFDPDRPVTPSTMKLLRSFHHVSPALTHNLWLAVPYIDALPPELRPKNINELRRAVATITACRQFLTRAYDVIEPSRGDRRKTQTLIRDRLPGLVKMTGGWTQLNDYFNGVAGGPSGLRDWNMMIVNHLVIPYAIQRLIREGHDIRNSVSEIFNGQGFTVPEYAPLNRFYFEASPTLLRESLDASSRWHDQMGAYNAKLAEVAKTIPTMAADALSEPVQAPNGLWISPLNTRTLLQDEGTTQHHCAGSQWSVVALGMKGHPAFMVSLSRDPERRQRVATATLVHAHDPQHDRGVPELRVHEHRAYGNGTPPEEARAALKWYCAEMGKMDRARWKSLVDAFAMRNKADFENKLVQLCGYDPFEDGKTRALYEGALRFYMPGRQKALGFDDWLVKSGLKAFVDRAIEQTFAAHPELRLRRAA